MAFYSSFLYILPGQHFFNIVLFSKTSAFLAFGVFSDLISFDMGHRLPVCIFQERPSLIQHDTFPHHARDLWAQTSSCEMSHPSVLSIPVNTNDSLCAICGPSGSSHKGPGRLLCIQVNMRRKGELFELNHNRILHSLGYTFAFLFTYVGSKIKRGWALILPHSG